MRRIVSGDVASRIAPERIALYDRLIATQPGLVRRGATMPYTSAGGHMFSFLAPDGTLALRLPPGDRERFIARHATSLHAAHGHVMKEYVTVPAAVLADTQALCPAFAASLAYVTSLKPKATRPRR
jgi:hypothetical protein